MKDYSVLDGITRNMKDCLITAYNKGYSRGYEDGWAVRSGYEPKVERQTEKTCDNCFHNHVCYRKESVKYIADYAEKCGDYEQMRKESHDN